MLRDLDVDPETGLSETEAERRLQVYGSNDIEARARTSPLKIILHQLTSPVVYVLVGACALAFAFGLRIEGFAVIAVLLINTLIGYWTEAKAVHSMEALRSLGRRTARVRRDGKTQLIEAVRLVPGDIILVEAGDILSADLRLVSASNLAANESTLTGESVPVDKRIEALPEQARLADRANMLFKGSSITRGTAIGAVVATGHSTELGKISQLVLEAKLVRSPLEQRLAIVASQLVWLTIGVATLIVAIGILRNADPMLMVTTGIALGVAAIPEGLPVVATLALAQGMWRMAKNNALIERLSAVETFGSTTFILTDKTGTLTENRMVVDSVVLPSSDPEPQQLEGLVQAGSIDAALEIMLETGALCNSSEFDTETNDGVGDPMEIALLRAAFQAGHLRSDLVRQQPLEKEYPFDAAVRMMATVHSSGEGYLFAVKGAPEEVIECCDTVRRDHGSNDLGAADRLVWHGIVDKLANQGLRVIAIARKMALSHEHGGPYEDLELLGLVGLRDPARADVPDAIAACKRAGIGVAIVTGDHAVTAVSIGDQIGLPSANGEAIEGRMLAKGDYSSKALKSTAVFARVNPEEKLELVRAFQDSGEIVAMTGDGVNDAPALRQADIGVAMGKKGTDVAREAAAMVLLDDAFPTIVKAIREGRIIFENIRCAAAYLLSCNLAEVLIIGTAVTLGLPLPILPLQILFLNLVTDTFPAFALATAKGDAGVMDHPPRPTDEPLLGKAQWRRIIVHGVVMTAATFMSMILAREWLQLEGEDLVAVTFLTLAFAQLWHVFNMVDPRQPLFRSQLVRSRWVWASILFCSFLLLMAVFVPAASAILSLNVPTLEMWALIIGLSPLPVIVLRATTHGLR